jgi:hypothetical protein
MLQVARASLRRQGDVERHASTLETRFSAVFVATEGFGKQQADASSSVSGTSSSPVLR